MGILQNKYAEVKTKKEALVDKMIADGYTMEVKPSGAYNFYDKSGKEYTGSDIVGVRVGEGGLFAKDKREGRIAQEVFLNSYNSGKWGPSRAERASAASAAAMDADAAAREKVITDAAAAAKAKSDAATAETARLKAAADAETLANKKRTEELEAEKKKQAALELEKLELDIDIEEEEPEDPPLNYEFVKQHITYPPVDTKNPLVEKPKAVIQKDGYNFDSSGNIIWREDTFNPIKSPEEQDASNNRNWLQNYFHGIFSSVLPVEQGGTQSYNPNKLVKKDTYVV